MREFVKSLASAGLAGTLFSVKQVANLVSHPPRSGKSDPATASFDAMTQAAADQCGTSLRETFHALDQIQQQAIDTGFRFVSLEAFRSKGAAESFSAMAQETTQQFRDWMGERCECGGQSCTGDCKCKKEPSDTGPWRSSSTSSHPSASSS